jgi:hypothetical protein
MGWDYGKSPKRNEETKAKACRLLKLLKVVCTYITLADGSWVRRKDARAMLSNIFDISIGEVPQSTYRRRVEIGGSVSTLSAGAYTATFYSERGWTCTPTLTSLR